MMRGARTVLRRADDIHGAITPLLSNVRQYQEIARAQLLVADDQASLGPWNRVLLLDGDELAKLVKKHLPQAYATRQL